MCVVLGVMCDLECVTLRLVVGEHLAAVGEEIVVALEQQLGDVGEVVRECVLERLSTAAGRLKVHNHNIALLSTVLILQQLKVWVLVEYHSLYVIVSSLLTVLQVGTV